MLSQSMQSHLLSIASTLVSEIYDLDRAEVHVVSLQFFFCTSGHGTIEGEAHWFLVRILLIFGTTVAHSVTADGLHISSFRLRKKR